MRKLRTRTQQVKDLITFPLRAIILFYDDRFGLSSLATERFDYVAREVLGYCLDIGCGEYNRFVREFLNGNGVGVDVFPYDGLTEENIVEDLTTFPFDSEIFDSVTFIANMNHIPRFQRDVELAEAYRVLKPRGNIIVTMGNPLAELLVHKLVWLYDRFLGTNYDWDNKRGMHEEEEYYLVDTEIIERLDRAGFKDIVKRYSATQWQLNHLFVGWKR
jgi:SAM-dependent methyltransferase